VRHLDVGFGGCGFGVGIIGWVRHGKEVCVSPRD
jgi:hypothetical protein